MRIHLAHGGADRVTINLLRALDRSRVDVRLLLLSCEGALLDEVPADVPVHSLDVLRLRGAVGPLMRAIKALDPDVLFSLDSGGNIPAVIAHRLLGHKSRLVLSERSILWNGAPTASRALQVLLKAGLYASADRITAVSDGVRDDLLARLHLDPSRVVVVDNPIVTLEMEALAREPLVHPWFADSSDGTARGATDAGESAPVVPSVPVILAVGRLVPAKDYPNLLRAFARVRERQPARLVILGIGPLLASLESLARELRIDTDVAFLGFDKNPYRYMARAHVYVLSSSNEGSPGTLIQAMACGAAVVSTDCPAGPAEIIRAPGSDGVLVPVGAPAALADAIGPLLGDPSRRARMGAAARASVERFRSATAVASYEDAMLRWPR